MILLAWLSNNKLFTIGFVVEPQSLNVTVGEEVVFQCEHHNSAINAWQINGTLLNDQPNLENDFIDTTTGRLHTLTVNALAKYNTTSIQCEPLFTSSDDQRSNEVTDPVVLQIQG